MAAVLPASLAEHLPAIEQALQTSLTEGPPEIIHASRYVMGWEDVDGNPASSGGKRIRPALCVFAGSLFGAEPEVVMPGAVAVELIHNFSLVHDEVQDHDAERHHRPTIWALHGEGQAINTGDFLITRAVAALTGAPAPADRRIAALAILNDAMARMIAGQWADLSFETRDDVTADEYLAMVRGKTAALLGAPLAMGATLAGASAAEADALARWGETVGLAFQVQDDYLGTWGNPNLTGKSNTNDIARKKKTLPIVLGMSGGAAVEIETAYARETLTDEDITGVVAALTRAGADRATRIEGERLVQQADALLNAFELPERSRQALRAIGTYLVERDS